MSECDKGSDWVRNGEGVFGSERDMDGEDIARFGSSQNYESCFPAEQVDVFSIYRLRIGTLSYRGSRDHTLDVLTRKRSTASLPSMRCEALAMMTSDALW